MSTYKLTTVSQMNWSLNITFSKVLKLGIESAVEGSNLLPARDHFEPLCNDKKV